MFTSLWKTSADENQSVSHESTNNNKKRIVIRDALKPIALYPNVQNKPSNTSDKDEEDDVRCKKARTR